MDFRGFPLEKPSLHILYSHSKNESINWSDQLTIIGTTTDDDIVEFINVRLNTNHIIHIGIKLQR